MKNHNRKKLVFKRLLHFIIYPILIKLEKKNRQSRNKEDHQRNIKRAQKVKEQKVCKRKKIHIKKLIKLH